MHRDQISFKTYLTLALSTHQTQCISSPKEDSQAQANQPIEGPVGHHLSVVLEAAALEPNYKPNPDPALDPPPASIVILQLPILILTSTKPWS